MLPKEEKVSWGTFVWNSKTGQFLGRSGGSWLRVFIFYVFFYAAVAAFFFLMLFAFYVTLDHTKPTYEGEDNLIGTNPGVGHHPQVNEVESTMVRFELKNQAVTDYWAGAMHRFIQDTNKAKGSNCTFGNHTAKPCKVNTTNFGPCNEGNKFGYGAGAPCFAIRLNRMHGWEPVAFGHKKEDKAFNKQKFLDNIKEKEAMPWELRDYIATEIEKLNGTKEQGEFAKSVFFSCDGENAIDKATIGGIKYYPYPYLPSYFFPYKKNKEYRSPFFMIHLVRPMPGVMINIECKAWAGNLDNKKAAQGGVTHFELFLEI